MQVVFDQQIFLLQEYGGISRYFSSLAMQLAEIEDVDVKIITPFYINAYLRNLPKGVVSGVKVPRIPKTARIVEHYSSWLARRAIARVRPQIVHETYYSQNSAAPKDTPRVTTVYDMIHERFSSSFPESDQTSECKRLTTQRVDHVICISENTRNDLLEYFGLPEDKVSVVYLGFDNLLSGNSVKPKVDKPYLLYVGQRGGYKNFENFMRAYASSSWLSNNFSIVCFGGGKLSGNELALFSELKLSDNQVMQFDGNDNKLAGYYSGAALFVYPSLYEGFGIPPLEAMSLDCPVACSNNSSIPEVVGNAAEYFDPNDVESICASIERVLSSTSRRAELIDYGRSRCMQFSWERCAKETLAIYRSLM